MCKVWTERFFIVIVDNIRKRFGYHAIQKGLIFVDKDLTGLHPQNDQHLIHPVNYFEGRIL